MSPCRGNSDASFATSGSVSSRRRPHSSRLISEVTRPGQGSQASQGGDGQAPPHVGSWPVTLVFVWLVHPSSENSFLFSSCRKRYRRLKKTLVQFKTMILISRPLIQRRKRCQVTTVLSEQGEAISALSRASWGLGEARAGMALKSLLGVTQWGVLHPLSDINVVK